MYGSDDTALKLKPHSLSLEGRERLVIQGASRLIAFHEDNVEVETSMGVLCVEGEGLHIDRLDLDAGQVVLRGHISALDYSDSVHPAATRGGLLGMLRR